MVNAVNAQNLILPTGTAKIAQSEYDVHQRGAATVAGLNDIPVRTVGNATTICVSGHVSDGFSPQTNIVRQDGQRGVLITILKAGSASTLDVVYDIRDLLPRVRRRCRRN